MTRERITLEILTGSFRQAVRAAQDAQYIYGRLGRQEEDGTYTVEVTNKPRHLYVTLNGEQSPTIAYNEGVNPTGNDGIPIRMLMIRGVLTIVGINVAELHGYKKGSAYYPAEVTGDQIADVIDGLAAKTTTVFADLAAIVDSEDGNALKQVTLQNLLPAGVVVTAKLANLAVSTAKIAANAVTHAKYQTIATQTILSNNTGASAVPAANTTLPSNIDGLYAKLLGRSGGQTLNGGTNAFNNLTLDSTAHATKGFINLLSTTIPGTDNSIDLGTVAKRWRDLWLANDAYIGTRLAVNTTTFNENIELGNSTNVGGIFRIQGGGLPRLVLENAYGDGEWVFSARSLDSYNLYISPNVGSLTGTNIASAAVVTIEQGGDVGIGTTNPSQKLHVNGNILANRIPTMMERQGGNASNWSTPGTTDYTPGQVKIQTGVVRLAITSASGDIQDTETVTFPTAFSNVPVVFTGLVNLQSGTDWQGWAVDADAITSTTAAISISRKTAPSTDMEWDVAWMAIGPL